MHYSKHVGNLTKDEARVVADLLESDKHKHDVSIVVGQEGPSGACRYVEAKHREGGLGGTLTITDLSQGLRSALRAETR